MKYDSDKNGFITKNEMMAAVSILSEDKVSKGSYLHHLECHFVARKKMRKNSFHNWMLIMMGRYIFYKHQTNIFKQLYCRYLIPSFFLSGDTGRLVD